MLKNPPKQQLPPHLLDHGAANPLTYEAAASIPQIDRISKQDAYRMLQNLPIGLLDTTETGPFKWLRFVCNVGSASRDLIGPGIATARLSNKWRSVVELTFVRQDDSQQQLLIIERGHGNFKVLLE